MTDEFGANEYPNPNNCSESPDDYLARASQACEAGDLVLGMHLYLAAYEQAVADPDIPDGMALAGLHEAWSLACELKERSMAEYVFEKLEPFLTADEIPDYANELQNLALDRLEEYGFSREELADMAEMLSSDLMGGEASVVKVESLSIPPVVESGNLADLFSNDDSLADERADEDAIDSQSIASGDLPQGNPDASGKSEHPERTGLNVADVNDFNPYDMYDTSSVGTSYHAATNDGSGGYVFTRDKDRAAQSERTLAQEAQRGNETQDGPMQSEAEAGETQKAAPDSSDAEIARASEDGDIALETAEEPIVKSEPEPESPSLQSAPQVFSYRNLVGFDEVVSVMRDLGVGLQRDQAFQNFVKMMNARHGLSKMPSLDTVLFRSPVIEDAARFLEATIGELGLPVLRMSMEENVQGMPMLCVAVQGNSRPRMNHAHNRFEGPGILVIEDLDMWAMPQPPEGMEGIGNLMMANISRGAREAVSLIRSAVEDPDVYVLATATTNGEVDPFFYDLLEPMTVVEIGYPNDHDRSAIWHDILSEHPSMRGLHLPTLTRLSAGLARYDIYLSAREAVEEAYKTGLMRRMFVPVTPQNMYDKLAACQPIESDEYKAIEEEAVRSLRKELDGLEDLLNGPEAGRLGERS